MGGEGGVQNAPKNADVINERPLISTLIFLICNLISYVDICNLITDVVICNLLTAVLIYVIS